MRLRGILLALAFSGSLSCGNNVTGPFRVTQPRREDIRLEVVTSPSSGSPGQPVTIRKIVRNAGQTTVYVLDMCPEPSARIHDTSGNELFLRNPLIPVACPANPPPLSMALAPGQSWEESTAFDGGYYSADGDHFEAAPGTYEARVRLMYSRESENRRSPWEPVTLTRDAPFTWR